MLLIWFEPLLPTIIYPPKQLAEGDTFYKISPDFVEDPRSSRCQRHRGFSI